MQAKPAEGHCRGLRVNLRKVEKMQLDSWVGERHSLAFRGDHGPVLHQLAGRERLRRDGLGCVVVLHNIEKSFQARLHAGICGVSVDFQYQIRLRPQLRGKQRMGEGVDRATEVADAEQKQVGTLLGKRGRIQYLIGEVPDRGPSPNRHKAIGGNHLHSHAGELFAHRLRSLGGVRVIAVARQQDRRPAVGQRLRQSFRPSPAVNIRPLFVRRLPRPRPCWPTRGGLPASERPSRPSQYWVNIYLPNQAGKRMIMRQRMLGVRDDYLRAPLPIHTGCEFCRKDRLRHA